MTRAVRYGIDHTGTNHAELDNVVKHSISSSIVLRLSPQLYGHKEPKGP